jgi:preprotein translocase subunit SecF
MNFISFRKRSYLISLFLVVVSLIIVFFFPKNLGIDMTGGVQITYTTASPITENTLTEVREISQAFDRSEEFIDIVTYPVE